MRHHVPLRRWLSIAFASFALLPGCGGISIQSTHTGDAGDAASGDDGPPANDGGARGDDAGDEDAPCACIDAGPAKGDAGPACGDVSCAVDEYCFEAGGGPMQPDGGSNFTRSCQPVPAACIGDEVPTCACLEASDAGISCMCTDGVGGPRVQCFYP